MISLTKQRSRRLRKKLRVGEFQELGFQVRFELRAELSESELTAFWDAFVLEAIERNGLAYGGGTEGYASSWRRGSATDAHRQTVHSWLSSRVEVLSVEVGPLADAWHGADDEKVL